MFPRLSRHLKFRQKYSAVRRIFNSLHPDETLSLLFKVFITSSTDQENEVSKILFTCIASIAVFVFEEQWAALQNIAC